MQPLSSLSLRLHSLQGFSAAESLHIRPRVLPTELLCQMPPVRSARNRKPPPDGFDDIEDTLLEFSNKMKDAENASHEGKKRHEVLWPIFQISHQRSFPVLIIED